MTEELETKHESLKFKVGNRVLITNYKNIFSKGYTKSWSKDISVIDSVRKTSPWTSKKVI